ncbi:hypothetical protein [Agromyces sp. H66]|uniref:SCO7613 C-terminal domain-containing membrane protein n=1 Tax=Agromyces sp. H66 TaxID=2529859 RepID=UPI00145A974D|nr:hypothetical protein [Agromyces sp. H66]
MTDRLPRDGAGDLRRWPSDPALLIDTTRCPACFAGLFSSRCLECGLDLAVPESAEVLAAGTRVYEAEAARQRLITGMREAQAGRESRQARAARAPVAAPVSAPTTVPTAPSPTAAPAPAAAPAPVAAPTPPSDALPTPPARRRSGVQVFLLTLGVVLISVAAIVFLFVAYLVASLEVRSAIIAGASVLVLGVAWLLRARRLPGTAEGVASVAVVLLLLDVWIVRANRLFGTEALDAAAYTGLAFAIVAAVLAATRAASGIRVPGLAAAALAPTAAFLLGYAIDPETATGVWLGGLAAVVVGAAAIAMAPRSLERTIMASAGFAGGVASAGAAFWALPEVRWGESWTFVAVAAGGVLVIVATRLARAEVASGWAAAAAIGVGITATLAPAVGIAAELDQGVAIWLAPAASGVIAAVAAGAVRRPASLRAEVARAAFISSAAVAAVTAAPGLLAGLASLGWRAMASSPAWQVEPDARVTRLPAELDLGAMLVPFVAAAGATVVLLVLGSLRRFAAVPIAAVLTGLLVIGATLPGAAAPAAIFAAVAAACLIAASTRFEELVPSSVPTLAVFGLGGAGLTVLAAYSNAMVWPWAIAAVLATAVAGRLLAPRAWPVGAARGVGVAHLVVAMLLVAAAALTLPSWFDASGTPIAPPWDSPWMWLGTVGAALLAVPLFAPRITDADRIGLFLPALVATMTGAVVTALVGSDPLRWLPAAAAAVVVLPALRRALPTLVRVLSAAAGPILLVFALERIVADIPDAPPSILGAAAAVLLAAAITPVVIGRGERAARLAWCTALGIGGLITLVSGPAAGDQAWLLLLLLTPVPLLVAALDGDPVGGSSPSRHLSWLSLALAIATVWTRLAGDGVDEIEAYSLPLAAALAVAAALITWRRAASAPTAGGRTALVAAAAAVAVLPSVGSSADSELRTLVLVAAGSVIAIASAFLPEAARGVPIRVLGVATGWVAFTGAAMVRGSAVAAGERSALPIEFWPVLALAAGVAAAVAWARTGSRPAVVAETMLAASVVSVSIPTTIAIVLGEEPTLRAAVLFPLLAAVHVAAVALRVRPIAGPILEWSALGVLVLGGIIVLVASSVDPFDVVTVPVAAALIGAGAFRMLRSPTLRSWPALGPGLAVLLLPALIADFTDPVLWRIIALGIVAAAAVVVGAVRRLQAPLLVGGGVLLVHAVDQLWPWITELYEAVWWWLWLGIAGVILVALAATYERQLRLVRRVAHSIAELR